MVAKAKLVPVAGQPYTGFFEGSDYAIIRLSDVKLRLDPEYAEHQKYVPSFAIKFLATGTFSVNAFGMSVDGHHGSENPYYFEFDQTNHPPGSADDKCSEQTIIRKFV